MWTLALVLISMGNTFVDAMKMLRHPTVVLLSFDGFRHDYIDKYNMKHFRELGKSGIRATALKSAFVTKTFPNHFTMVTGLYEETHGILSNMMYDPVYKESFSPAKSSKDPKWWNATVPIWITNELNLTDTIGNDTEWSRLNRTRKSATIFWPGSEVPYKGHRQFFDKEPYDDYMPTRARFNLTLNLLLEDDAPNFIACYFKEPDSTSHDIGTNHPKLRVVLRQLDYYLGEFIQNLKKHGLFDQINLILVSDHGMADVSPSRVMAVDHFVDPSLYDLTYYGTYLLVRPKPGHMHQVYEGLRNVSHITTYLKKDIPESAHYKHNRRVPEIFALAEEGYYFVPSMKEKLEKNHTFGNHGYNNTLMSMHGLFIAHGPRFQEKLEVGILRNIDLYVVMCHILDIVAHPNNGSLEMVSAILRPEESLLATLLKKPWFLVILLTTIALAVTVTLVCCFFSCVKQRPGSAYSRINNQIPLADLYEEDDDDVVEYNYASNNNKRYAASSR